MSETREPQQAQLEARISDTIGGDFPAVAYSLSFYPQLADKFIKIQEECRKGSGGKKGFWLSTAPGEAGRDVLHEIPEANGILKMEREVAALRGQRQQPDYYPNDYELEVLVRTFRGRDTPLNKIKEEPLKIYEDMRRKALDKLQVTDEEIGSAEQYLSSAQKANQKEGKAAKLEEQARQLKKEALQSRQAGRDAVKRNWKK